MLPFDVEVKPIPGYPHYYVSKEGYVWSEKRGYKTKPYFDFGQWLKPQLFNSYLTVVLSNNGQQKRFKIHRLVLETYLGPRPPDHFACHKDGDKFNNCLSNLVWGTRKESSGFSRKNRRWARGEMINTSKLTETQVRKIKKLLRSGKYTQTEIGKMYGVTSSAIYRIDSGRNWKHVK